MAYSTNLYFLVGPSGVGKDTLLNALKRQQYSDKQPLVAHRYITRPVRENDENHIELSHFDFNRRKEGGLFLFDWESHGYCYGIGKEVKKWRKSGFNVIVNGSRKYLEKARVIYPVLTPIWMTISEEVLRQRLFDRDRENEEQVQARIDQNRGLEKLKPDDCVYINNDQSIEDTIGQLMALVEISNI